MTTVVTYRPTNVEGMPFPFESPGPVELTHGGYTLNIRPYDSQHGDGSLGPNFLADGSDASWIDLASIEGVDPTLQYTWVDTFFDAQTIDLTNATAFEFRARVALDNPDGPAPQFVLVAYDGSLDSGVAHDVDEDVAKIQWASDVVVGTVGSPVNVGGEYDSTNTHTRGQYLADILAAGNLHLGIAIGGTRETLVHVYELFLRVTYEDDVFPVTTGELLADETPIAATNEFTIDPVVIGTNDGTVLTDDSPDTYTLLQVQVPGGGFTQLKIYQSAPTIRDDSPARLWMVLKDTGTRGSTDFLVSIYDDADSSWLLQFQPSIPQDGRYHAVEYVIQPGDAGTPFVSFPDDVYDHSKVVQAIRNGTAWVAVQANEDTETSAALYTLQFWVEGTVSVMAPPLRQFPRPHPGRHWPPSSTRQQGLRRGPNAIL